jgi:phage-related tail protein
MKLIQEASIDDQFANLLMKVDDAFLKLEKLAGQFSKLNRPVGSQISMCESAADDFTKLAKKLRELKDAK